MKHLKAKWDDQKMENAIGRILRTGVLLSALFIIVGGTIHLVRYGLSAPNTLIFHGQPSDLKHVSTIVRAALQFHASGLIQFGLLILIATPVARVVLSVFAFARQRDILYVVVALIVLALLVISMAKGLL